MKLNRAFALSLSAALLIGFSAVAASAAGTIFPATKGSTWKYTLSNGAASKCAITSSANNRITEKFSGPTSLEVRLKRTPGGWATADVGRIQNQAIHGQHIKIKIVRASGVVIPRTALWKPGYKWHYTNVDRATIHSGPINVLQRTVVKADCVITGFKDITVPAGKFHCLCVRTTLHTVGTTKIMGRTQTQKFKSQQTQYYAKGVGLVESKMGNIVSKLSRYHIAG